MQSLPRQTSILDSVYVAVRDAICDGELAPGARVTQDEIAERLGVSRQPVVQALVLLKSQGFFRETGRRGLIVTPVSAETVRAIYELRGSLDETAARLAAERARPEDLAEGWEILAEGERLAARGDIGDLVKCDMAFHEFIYALSGNPLIAQALEPQLHHLRRVMTAVIEAANYRTRLWREHADILKAIADRKADRAGALSRAHVGAASAEIQAKLKAGDPEQQAAGASSGRKRNDPSGAGADPGDARQGRPGRA
ncbi:MAG: GntR family transcriptional regulator [Dichotomicrobium sp.]